MANPVLVSLEFSTLYGPFLLEIDSHASHELRLI